MHYNVTILLTTQCGETASTGRGQWLTSPLVHHTLQGRFTIAAKHHISIAEIYEAELVDIEKVRQEFIKDFELFMNELMKDSLASFAVFFFVCVSLIHLVFVPIGNCTLWTSSRLLQRRGVKQVRRFFATTQILRHLLYYNVQVLPIVFGAASFKFRTIVSSQLNIKCCDRTIALNMKQE